jgi:hypothetical protein
MSPSPTGIAAPEAWGLGYAELKFRACTSSTLNGRHVSAHSNGAREGAALMAEVHGVLQ